MCTEVADSLSKPKTLSLGVYYEIIVRAFSPGLTNSRYNELFSGSLQSPLYRDSTVFCTPDVYETR